MTIESNSKCNKTCFSREIRCSCVYAHWGITGHCFYCKLKAKYTDQIEETRRSHVDDDLDTDSSDEELTSPTIIKSKAEPHPHPSMEIDPATSTG